MQNRLFVEAIAMIMTDRGYVNVKIDNTVSSVISHLAMNQEKHHAVDAEIDDTCIKGNVWHLVQKEHFQMMSKVDTAVNAYRQLPNVLKSYQYV